MPMIAITTKSSTSVKPCRVGGIGYPSDCEVKGSSNPYMEFTIMVTRANRAVSGNATSAAVGAATSPSHRWCVGIDLHKDTMTICVYCPAARDSFPEDRLQEPAAKSSSSSPAAAAARRGDRGIRLLSWLWNLLEPLVEKLVLADATQARALAGRRLKPIARTPKISPSCWPSVACRRATRLPWKCRFSKTKRGIANQLSRLHAQVLKQVKSLMTPTIGRPSGLQSEGLIRYLKAFASKLPERHVAVLWKYVDQLTLIERQIEQAEIELRRLLAQERFRDTVAILQASRESA